MNRHLCIHGHFYQPPRENPWLNEVEVQESAFPWHDWNARINAECYEPNSASRILDNKGRITAILNNYSRISFNFGPTLLEWMEKKAPEVYKAILEADKKGMERYSGHGTAIAQVYNHLIMPLANERDKETQVKWGLADFERRFGRNPEGIWLSETAVDTATLEVLAEHGIKYTILSPYQAKKTRKTGEKEWTDVSGGKVDFKHSYKCILPSGKEIALFFYHGEVSQAVAFEKLLNNGEKFAKRLLEPLKQDSEKPQLMNIATDGETYGHHHSFGEMALSYALHVIEENQLINLTVYGEYLKNFPPEREVEIVEHSSWSCQHGVERWKSDCGCNTGGHRDWNQKWRAPLRETFDWLRDLLIPVYEEQMKAFSSDPWKTRNDYIRVILDRSDENVDAFIREQCGRELSTEEQVTFLKLLEMQYHLMLMYTSCGWFFDEVSGIETVQVISYAYRAVQLAREAAGKDLEREFAGKLAAIPSNLPEFGNAGKAYDKFVKPMALDLSRVAAHYGVSSLFEEYPESSQIYSYKATCQYYLKREAGKQKLAIGRVFLQSKVTRESEELCYAVLHLGEHNLFGGVRSRIDDSAFREVNVSISTAFKKGNIFEVMLLMDQHFGSHNYSFWHLFRDDQRRILDQVIMQRLEGVEGTFMQIYENNFQIIQAMNELQGRIPIQLQLILDFTVNSKLKNALEEQDLNLPEIERIAEEILQFHVRLEKRRLEYLLSNRVGIMMKVLMEDIENPELLRQLVHLLGIINRLPLEPNYWQAQNYAFKIKKKCGDFIEREGERGEKWGELFYALCQNLNVKL